MKTYNVSVYFAKPPVFGWIGEAETKMQAKSFALQYARAQGFKSDFKKSIVETIK